MISLTAVSTEVRERPAVSGPNPAEARLSGEEGDPQPERLPARP